MKHTLTPFIFFFFGAVIGITGGLGKTNLQLGIERYPIGALIISVGYCFWLKEAAEKGGMTKRPSILKMAAVPSLLAISGWCFLSSSPDSQLIPFLRLGRVASNVLGWSLISSGIFALLASLYTFVWKRRN